MSSLPQPDVITQLQTCLDQLATQFYASLRYITTHHPLSHPPGTVYTAPANAGAPPTTDPPQMPASPTHTPVEASTFTASTRELARDLVLKQRQIEGLLRLLPTNIEHDEREQELRIAELQAELSQLDAKRAAAAAEREVLLERVEDVIALCKRE